MKAPGISRYLLHLLFMQILTIGLVTSQTGTSWKQKAEISSNKDPGHATFTKIPDLSEFTACLDILLGNDAASTALSYCAQDGVIPEFGFSRKNSKLEVFHLEMVHTVDIDWKKNVWYTICAKWKRQTKQLEVYVNGKSIYNATTEDRMIKGNGSLVLGAQHTNQGGQIVIKDGAYMFGELYNYQMWNYTRSQEELLGCIEGNLISWTKEPWSFRKPREDVQLRCANATVTPTPTASTTTPTTTLANATVTPTPTASKTTPTTTLANATVTPTSTASTTTPTTTLANATVTPTPTASTSTSAKTLANATVTQTSTASTTTPTTTLANATVTPTPTASTTTPTTTLANATVTPTPTASTSTSAKTLANATVTPTSTASTTTSTTTLANATVTPTPTASTTTPTTTLANATVTPTPTASTTTSTKTLGTTTSTMTPTPAPDNSAPTGIFSSATESLSSVTSTPGIFSTSVTQRETSSSNSSDNLTSTQLPNALPTSLPGKPNLSTTVSLTESLPGETLLANSSIELTTGNNVSTTGNISSTYHSPPALRTTSAVPISSLKNYTTIQQESTDYKSTLDHQVVSTRTPSISTQPEKTSEPMNGTTVQVLITSPTTKSITPSTVTNVSSTFSSSSSSTHPPSTVITSSSKQSTTPHSTPNGVTESAVSHLGTTYITSASISIVTFYIVQITFTTPSTDVIDEDMTAFLIHSMMNQFLNDTEFAAVQVIVSNTSTCCSNEPGNDPTQKNNKKKRESNDDSGESNPPVYIAKSIVRANSSRNPEVLADELGNLLKEGFTDPQLNLSLTAQDVTTDPLDAKHCNSESTYYDDFPYTWPDTNPTEKATLKCPTNLNEMATRDCYINVTTLKTEWGDPNYSKCIPSSFEDLENVNVTQENANYLAMQILNMTKKAASLPENDISIILNKVSEIIALGDIEVENAKVYVDVINFVLIKGDNSLRLFTNKILNLMEEVGFKMNFPSDTANVTTDSMALLVSKKFEEMYFTVTTYLDGNVEIALEQFPPHQSVAFIHLPKSVEDEAEISSSKVQFNFIGNLSLFQDYESSNLILNTYIISASFEGTSVKDLVDSIDIKLLHFQENVEKYPVQCAFWDFAKNNNMGGWNTSGCKMTFTNKEYTMCSCNHLTHFGVLLDISRTKINPLDDHILSLLTYVGCGIASLFLGVALVTYGMFRQLRRDYPSKILMNLSFSLLMLNLLFLVNNWLSSFRSQGLCISVAACLHYFLLTSFTWMGLEAVHMYFAFVKVFNSYIHKYILKLCIAGWGIPLVVVAAVLCVNVNFYGEVLDNEQNDVPGDSDAFCWIQNEVVFYVTVVSYFGVIFLTNISMFIVVLLQIKSLKSTRIKDWKALFLHDIKNTLSLAFLLGLTWGFAFFAWGPVRVAFLYLFAIFNTLQGFFIFVFHCLIKENVRRHWRMYLCCGKCQLDNYSDWSRLSNVDTKYNGRLHFSPSDSYQSTKSSNTASTSNTSSLSSLSRDAFYGRSSVDGGGIFISSAYTAPPYHANVYPDKRRILTFLDLDTQ